MSPTPEPKRRLSLTKAQLQESSGAALLDILKSITSDGQLAQTEIERLASWIGLHKLSEMPAVTHLTEIVERVLEDRVVTPNERLELQLGIEKVLPVTERGFARAAREAAQRVKTDPKISRADLAAMASSTDRETDFSPTHRDWRDDSMTERQRDYIVDLGGSISTSATKGEACDLITILLGKRPPTNRQQMVMRFWGRTQEPGEGPAEISDWQDAFYSKDPDRKNAWELFKEESNDDGRQGDPTRVPIGIGAKYLERIKGASRTLPPVVGPSTTNVSSPHSSTSTDRQFGANAKPQARQPDSPASKRPFGTISLVVALTATVVAGVWFIVSRPPNPKVSLTTPSADSPQTAMSTGSTATISALTTKTERSEAPMSVTETKVAALKFTGVIGGKRAQAMIDGTLYTVGDPVDRTVGILVYAIDEKEASVTFIDLEGKIYERSLR